MISGESLSASAISTASVVVIKPDPVPAASVDDRPMFIFENIFSSPSGSESGSDVLVTGTTWDRWEPLGTSAWVEQSHDAALIDVCLIAAHNLTEVAIQRYESGAWETLATYEPAADEGVFIVPFAQVVSTKTRVLFFAGIESVSVGVLMVGKAVRADRKIYAGHMPGTLNPLVKRLHKNTIGAHAKGNSERARAYVAKIAIHNLTPAWAREESLGLRMHIDDGKPFGFAWRPGSYAQEVLYCWGGPVRTSNTGPRDYMDWQIDVEAYA